MADGYISQIKTPDNKVYDFRDQHLKVYTGSCTTAAGTAIKDVTTDGEFTLAKGAVIFVNFSATNTAAVADLKLRVNSNAANDAKPIKHEYNASEANLPGAGYLRANQTYQFYYDGTNWVTDVGRDANSTYSYMRPYENTGKGSYNSQGENPVKTGAAGWRFQLSAGKYFMYSHYYDNTAKSALTLNIGSTGAKPIYINGQPSSVDNYTLPGGQYLVYYDGTNYYFRTDDKMTGNITGNAATASSIALSGVTGADDLKAIEAISGTTGLLKKTAANTWTLDTSTYLTSHQSLAAYAKLASPEFTGTPTAPTAANGTSTTQIATTAFVNNTLSYVNAMRFKGTLGTGGTVTALPASHETGDTYRVITAGTWAGEDCAVGTLIICTTDGTTANDAHWACVGTNEDGTMIGPESSTDNAIARFDGTTGRIIQNSGITINDDGNLVIAHSTNATMTTASTNPQIIFSENGTQPVHLIYNDVDKYRSPAGLKIIGGTSASPAWLEVEGNIYAAAFKGHADSATSANYLYPFSDGTNVSGTTDISILTNIYNKDDIPRNAPFGVKLQHGNTSVGFGYFYSKSEYGGWYIANYGGPSYIGLSNGTWTSYTFLTNQNYTSYAVAKTAGVTAVTWDATNKKLTRTINGTAADVMTAAQISTALDLGTIASKAENNYIKFGGDDTNLGSGSPASNAKTYWADTTKVSDNMITGYYNHSGIEYSLLFSKRSNYGSILKWGYNDRYLRILRVHAGTWQSTDWEKIDAGYADSAGSASQLSQTSITDLNSFTHTTNLIYAAAAGSNSIADKPSGVDAFGVLSYKTANGWYGQILTASNTESGIYWRTGTTLSGGWNKLLDSSNYTDYTVTKTGAGASGTWDISVTGTAANVTSTVAIEHGGTGATSAADARTNLNTVTGNARVFYGTCATAAATTLKEVICAEYDKVLTIGDMLIVKFDNTNSGAVGSLQITVKNSTSDSAGTTAKNIKRQYNSTGANNLVATGELNKDSIAVFVYNGTYWILTNADYNNTYSYDWTTGAGGNGRTAETAANGGVGIHRYSLQMMTLNLTWSSLSSDHPTAATTNGAATDKTVATCSFLLDSPIIYQDTNANAIPGNSANVNGFTTGAINLQYSTTNAQWSALTIQKPVYLIGTLQSDGTFKLNATKWWTQTLPTSDDGQIYIFLGLAYSATNIYLHDAHPIYWYKNGEIQPYAGYATATSRAAITTTANAVAYYTNTTGTFGSKASANGALYATSANGALQWGTLPIAQGGTGVVSFTKNQVILSDNTNGTTGLISRAYSDSTSAGALSNSSTNFVTERDIYFGLPTLNNAHNYTSSSTYYAPTTGGTAGHILIGTGTTTAPAWYGGTVMSGSAAASWITAFNGTTDATATNAAAVTIAGGLGIGKKLYVGDTATVPDLTIGSTNEYGDAYTPIYWHEGVPATVTLTQQCAFTIKSGNSGVRLSHAAITVDSYVTEIVITSGESKLNSIISWTSAAGYIELTCSSTVSGDVTGYIMISRGGEITATATDIA